MYHRCAVQVRYCDTDMLGHINNTALAQWLEVGRVELERDCLPGPAYVMLRKLDIDFVAEMHFGGAVEIRTGVDEIGNTSLVLHQEIWQEGRCGVTARVVEVWFDPQTRRPTPVPSAFRAVYEQLRFGDERFVS